MNCSFWGWMISLIVPRAKLQEAMTEQWVRTLPRAERLRFFEWGATGNPDHHQFAWADTLPKTIQKQ